MIEVWIDGLCEPVMPKYARIACLGYVIKENGKTIDKSYEVIGKGANMTNNVAEYSALIYALKRIKELKLDEEEIIVRSDSKLVVNQMKEEWKVKKEHLKPLFYKAKILASDKDIVFEWIPREENTEADTLSRIAHETAISDEKKKKWKTTRKRETQKYFEI